MTTLRRLAAALAATATITATASCTTTAESQPAPAPAPAAPAVPDYAAYTAALAHWAGSEMQRVTDTYDEQVRADSICRQLAGDPSQAAQDRLVLKLRLELSNWLDARGNLDDRTPDDIEATYTSEQVAAAVKYVCP